MVDALNSKTQEWTLLSTSIIVPIETQKDKEQSPTKMLQTAQSRSAHTV